MRKLSFEDIKRKHDEEFILSTEVREKIASQNFSAALILNHLLLLFGLLNDVVVFIRFRSNLTPKKDSIIYFSAFVVFAVISLIYCLFAKNVFKTKKAFWLNVPFYYSMLSAYCCVSFRILSTGSSLSGAFLIALVSLVSLIFCNCNPLIFILMLIPPFFVEGYVIHLDYSLSMMADLTLFYIGLVILAHYKRNSTVKEAKVTVELEGKKKKLEDAFSEQSAEIETQAVELIHQNRKLIKMQDETIISLSNLVENRDIDTGEHVKRTSHYINILAKAALKDGVYSDVITEDFIELATKAAPLHDIGKIVVPDAILKKPGKLTDEEFEQIKRHTTEGGKIVRDVLGVSNDEDYIKMASDIAMYHHEKWNGEGYPTGLKGEEIPVSARLMAIADVYDALVSKRCYKKSMSYEEAIDIIKISSGSHFDPQLVDLFLKSTKEFEEVAKKYKD